MASKFVLDFPLMFLNRGEATVIDALVGQIIPSEPGSPGAREAGVTEYIDKALGGFLRELQSVYRSGLIALAEFTAGIAEGRFHELSDGQQEEVVRQLAELSERDPSDFAGQFFRIVREHTVQGFFGDPAYGGNRRLVGWELVGFPGAQWGYTAEQMAPDFDTRTIPMLTIKDLYSRIGGGQ